MTPEQFAYWLQGYSEICGQRPTDEQWAMIQDHLKTVFHKVTPDYPPPKYCDPEKVIPNSVPPYIVTCSSTPPYIEWTGTQASPSEPFICMADSNLRS